MRLELVVTGTALVLVGSLFLSLTYAVPTYETYGFGPFSWSEQTGTTTRTVASPFGTVLIFLGVMLVVLGLAFPRPQPEQAPASVVYYVPTPPSAAAPPPPPAAPVAPAPPAHVPAAAFAAPPPPARPQPAATTAPPGSFATPLPGQRPATRVPAASAAAGAVTAPSAPPAPPTAAPVTLPPARPPPAPVPVAPDASLIAGTRVLDKFEVERGLGQGTFGGTHLARDVLLDRRVVLKELLPQWREDADATARFVKEAKVVASLRHPNIVHLYGVERWGSGLLLVMEYADGGSLAQTLRERKRLPEAEAVRIVDQVLAALEAVHAQGILHRDVKPSNILLTRANEVRLADFGIAYAPTFGATMGERPGTSHPGSLPFMAPEQVEGRELDARADLYAVGATLYYLVVGAPYVDLSGKSHDAMREAVLKSPPRLPVDGLTAEMNALLTKALAKRREDRFASASEMRRWLPGR